MDILTIYLPLVRWSKINELIVFSRDLRMTKKDNQQIQLTLKLGMSCKHIKLFQSLPVSGKLQLTIFLSTVFLLQFKHSLLLRVDLSGRSRSKPCICMYSISFVMEFKFNIMSKLNDHHRSTSLDFR